MLREEGGERAGKGDGEREKERGREVGIMMGRGRGTCGYVGFRAVGQLVGS